MSSPRAVFLHSSKSLYIKAGLEDPKEVWQGDCETFYNIYIIVLCFSREITHSVISTVSRNLIPPAALHTILEERLADDSKVRILKVCPVSPKLNSVLY